MKNIICLVIAVATRLNAQDSLSKVRSIHYRFDYGYGVRLIDNLSNINRELVSNGYPEISKTLTGFEFGLHFKRKRLGMGLYKRMYWGNGEAMNQQKFSPSSTGADWRLTYSLSKNPKFSIEPLIGLGNQSFEFKLRDTQSQPILVVLQNPPQRSLSLKYGSAMAYCGVSLGTRIRSIKSRYGQGNVFLGIQLVYNFSFGIWTVNDRWVDSKNQLSGWQIKLVATLEAVVSRRSK